MLAADGKKMSKRLKNYPVGAAAGSLPACLFGRSMSLLAVGTARVSCKANSAGGVKHLLGH